MRERGEGRVKDQNALKLTLCKVAGFNVTFWHFGLKILEKTLKALMQRVSFSSLGG